MADDLILHDPLGEWRHGGSTTRYIEAAQSKRPVVDDYIEAARIAWKQVTYEEVPAGLIEAIEGAGNAGAAYEIVVQWLRDYAKDVEDAEIPVTIGQAIVQTAAARAALRYEVAHEFTPKELMGDAAAYLGVVPDEYALDVEAVEEELTKRTIALTPDDGGIGKDILEGLIEDEPDAPDIAGDIRREMGFIGNLDSPTYTGIIDGSRIPVDPSSGKPINQEYHDPKGIYNVNEDTQIAGQRDLDKYQNEMWINAGQTGGYGSLLEVNVPHIQRYVYGFQWEPASWDPVEIARVKDRLVKAGLLKEDDRSTGAGWSHYEAKAFEALAVAANGTGELWNTTLQFYEGNPVGGGPGGGGGTVRKRDPFIAPSYLAPDMDVLKQAVKDSVRGRLGREPTAAEMGQLIGGLDSDYRSAYNVQVQASRSEYDATTRAIESGTEQSGGEFRNVDPASSFAERFEMRFDNELGFKKRRDDLNVRQSYTDATMRMIDSIAGGG